MLLDLRKSTAVRLLTGADGSARVEVATTLTSLSERRRWSCECPFNVSLGTEVLPLSRSNFTRLGHLSGLESMGLRVGGSELLSEFVSRGKVSDGSSFGGRDLSPENNKKLYQSHVEDQAEKITPPSKDRQAKMFLAFIPIRFGCITILLNPTFF